MPRSTGTQTRTFNYNNTAFLQSATNPENGTVNYTYTASGALATKIDAKGQKVVYTYDAGHPRRGPSRTSASASATTTIPILFPDRSRSTRGAAGPAWSTGMRV
jgi:YD repeat-containing protein